jgi:hypothetical protein
VEPTSAVAAATLILSTAAKVGTVDQIRINHLRGCAGFSWRREGLYVSSYTAWVAHGALSGDLVVAASGVLGALLSAALLGQVVHARWGDGRG